MIGTENRVQSATIVARRSGPGFRLVLCLRTRSGTPVLETLPDSFASVASAARYAIEQLRISRGQVRLKAAIG